MADRYYTTGGTLSHDAPSYVERDADRALIEGLNRGEFCYILTSRQMGKSSLMIRTASKLRVDDDTRVAVLDLAAVGQNLNPEQWYDGMLLRLGRQLDLEDEFDDFWLDHPRLSPVQRFFEALHQVALKSTKGRLVIFVDELDTVRSLPFSSDEFFAAIRHCYNERSQNPIWDRLTFCLLGVATPSDLIQDPHISPFNIGRRIVLEDFKRDEVAKLVEGLDAEERGDVLLERIFGWTNGHPYLTQRLCRAVAEQNRSEAVPSVRQPGMVDGICHRLFLSNRAKERDDNLMFVRERLLRSDHDRAAVLDLYRKVRSGRIVADDETNPLIGTLHLSGVTQIVKGNLKVRNRIYWHVFSGSWVQATMPDAEKRRQREAYRRGVIRTTALSFLIVAAMIYLAATAYVQSKRARARLIAQNTDHGASLLAAGENFDALAWFAENLKLSDEGSVQEELGRKRFATVLRHSPRLVAMLAHEGAASHVAFSPDGETLVSASEDQMARIWSLDTGEPLFDPMAHGSSVTFVAFNSDGTRLVTASADQSARLFDARTGESLGEPMRHDYEVIQASFSPDGRYVATASLDDSVRVWNAETGQPVTEPLKHRYAVNHVDFGPSSEVVVTASKDGSARMWSFLQEPGSEARVLQHEGEVTQAKFSADGKLVACATTEGWFRLWRIEPLSSESEQAEELEASAEAGEETEAEEEEEPVGPEAEFTLKHPASVTSIDFSPDGSLLAIGCEDGLVRVLDVAQRQLAAIPLIHRSGVQQVQFSPGGDLLLSVTLGNEARVWDVSTGQAVSPPFRHLDHIYHAAFDSTGRRVATAGADGLVKVWDLAGVSARTNEWEADAVATAVAYSPDGDFLAYGLRDGQIIVRNSNSGEGLAVSPFDHGGEVLFLRFSQDSNQLLSAGFRGKAKLWELATGELKQEFIHEDAIHFAVFNRVGTRLITASRDKTAVIWNLETGEAAAPPVKHRFSVVNAVFASGGREFATASADNSVSVWNALTGDLVRGPFRTGYSLGRPAFDSDGDRFAALTSPSSARVFSLGNGKGLSREMNHRDEITYLSFDGRGGRVVTTSRDHTARAWDSWNGRPLSPPLRHTDAVHFAQFSEDNHQLLTLGDDQTAKLWSVRQGAPLTPPMRHDSPVSLAALSFQSDELLTISSNRVVRWGLTEERRSREVLIREAELLSGRKRDSTGELMGMSSTNLLDSWSTLSNSHPELFSVDLDQQIEWHGRALRQAGNRDAYGVIGYHAAVLSGLTTENESQRRKIAGWLQSFHQPPPLVGRRSAIDNVETEAIYMSRLPVRLQPRSEGLRAAQIDLSTAFNGLLEDGWQYTSVNGNSFRGLPTGRQEFEGITFDLRGVVQVNSSRLQTNSLRQFPDAVRGIPIGQSAARIHVLHAVAYPSPKFEVVGQYVFHFADGQDWNYDLVYGRDVADWWNQNAPENEPEVKIVWQLRTGPSRVIRVFLTTIEVPRQDVEIVSMDLVGGNQPSAPFLLAVTLE